MFTCTDIVIRPTHYYVVYDEIGFQADELQTLTNGVSYLFSRATKAVSLVTPAYMADLCCERGRCYLHKMLSGISSSAGTTTSGDTPAGASGMTEQAKKAYEQAKMQQVMKEAQELWHGGAGGTLKETMYYL